MSRAYLGLGSNLGDRAAAIERALERLAAARGVRLLARSGLYETEPWGKRDQPPFLNAAAAIETTLDPHALLRLAQGVETDLGRVRAERWGPRVIDIDLLHVEGARLRTADLTLPHPRMAERAFVLVPLLEIAPELTIDGASIASMVKAVGRDGVRAHLAGNRGAGAA